MIWQTGNARIDCCTFLEIYKGPGYNGVISFAIGLLVPEKIDKNWYSLVCCFETIRLLINYTNKYIFWFHISTVYSLYMVITRILHSNPLLLLKTERNLALKIFPVHIFREQLYGEMRRLQASLLRACMRFFIHAPFFDFCRSQLFSPKTHLHAFIFSSKSWHFQ